MIGQVMRYCKNYFPTVSESAAANVTAHKIEGTFEGPYFAGQYIYLMGTRMNDGVCRVAAFDTTGITVDETLTPETGGVCRIVSLAPPRDFLDLVSEITTHGNKAGVASESIDDYSVTYADGGGWERAFRARLSPYRCAYNALEEIRDADCRLLPRDYAL